MKTTTALAGQVGLPLSSSQQIQDLHAASAVRRVGVSTVAGQRATGYRYVVNFSRLTALPVRLWVDGEGRPVLERASFGYHGATINLSVTSSYGNAVHVTAPPARLMAAAPAAGVGDSGTA